MTNTELNKLINDYGLTTPRLARILKVSIHAVNKWRNGQRKISPAIQELIKIKFRGRSKK